MLKVTILPVPVHLSPVREQRWFFSFQFRHLASASYLSPYWSRNDPIYQVIFSTVLVPYKMHAESWELDLNSEFRVLTSWISLTLSSTIQNACNNKNDLKVGIDFQCSMNMVPKCRTQIMHDWIPALLSARTRDCRRRPDLIARPGNHNSTQAGCHVASRTRSTDLQKMTSLAGDLAKSGARTTD